MQSNAQFAHYFKQGVCAAHVGVGEHQRPEDALVHMHLGGEVEDQVNVVSLAGSASRIHIANVSHNQRQVGVVPQVVQVFLAASVCKLVIHDNLAFGVLFHPVAHKVAADETAPAGNENIPKIQNL